MGWVFSFSSSQECKDCTRSRKCSDYSSSLVGAVFLSPRFFLLCLLRPAGAFCRRAKCERAFERPNERTGAVKGTFLLLYCGLEMPLACSTSGLIHFPHARPVARTMHSLSLRPKSFEVLRRSSAWPTDFDQSRRTEAFPPPPKIAAAAPTKKEPGPSVHSS